jgi:hypothetical protein
MSFILGEKQQIQNLLKQKYELAVVACIPLFFMNFLLVIGQLELVGWYPNGEF